MSRWLLLLVFATPILLHGETPTSDQKSLAFEVASVKPNTDVGAMPSWKFSQGAVTITAIRLHQLIAIAYDSPSIQTRDQIVGGPTWIKSDHFDIVAKTVPANLENDEFGRQTRLLAMLRSLLEDRFKLRMHSERREAPVYLLMLANANGRVGPQLHRSTQPDCRGANEYGLPENITRWCGWRGFGTGHYTIQGLTMEDLARGIASAWSVGRPVLDRTGLSGRWEAQLDFVPTFVAGPNPEAAPVQNPSGDSGPDTFSALRDQLGLKLQGGKTKVEYLVIDRVERPTED